MALSSALLSICTPGCPPQMNAWHQVAHMATLYMSAVLKQNSIQDCRQLIPHRSLTESYHLDPSTRPNSTLAPSNAKETLNALGRLTGIAFAQVLWYPQDPQPNEEDMPRRTAEHPMDSWVTSSWPINHKTFHFFATMQLRNTGHGWGPRNAQPSRRVSGAFCRYHASRTGLVNAAERDTLSRLEAPVSKPGTC